MPDVRFRLTIPPDVRLVAAVRQLAERVAQCAGYPAADAARLASSVEQAIERVLARPAPNLPGGRDALDIRFERDGAYLDVWLRQRMGAGEWPAADPLLENDALRQGVDTVETGREGDVAYWRLRRRLPHEKADHQCEAPADPR